MKTIEIYEKTETSKLQEMLKTYEQCLEESELKLASIKCGMSLFLSNEREELNKKIIDYEIDVSLIRMELNKRLWKEKE
jgi:hypothetical protein